MDVGAAVVQVGHDDGHRRQPVIEVLAEPPISHGLEQVDVGGGHDAHVGLLDYRRTDLQELARFEHAQQAGLGGERKLGPLEIALAGGDGAGERALLVSEQFGVDGAFGYSPAVDGYVFLMFAGAELVDNLGEEFLARSALAVDEHRQVDRGHAHGPRDGLEQGRRVANDAEALLGLLYLRRVCIHLYRSEHFGCLQNRTTNLQKKCVISKKWRDKGRGGGWRRNFAAKNYGGYRY